MGWNKGQVWLIPKPCEVKLDSSRCRIHGKEAFVKVHDYLAGLESEDKNDYCMAGFILGNTLSENGTVTRGVCKVNDKGLLVDIVETREIEQKGDIAVASDGKDGETKIDLNFQKVSF